MNTKLRSTLLLIALSPAAWSSDWYVDVNNGSDSNSGAAPTQAWKTITWAVSQTPQSGAQRIFVAAGTYDVASGEIWPVALRPELQLIGAGSIHTTLVGSGPQLLAYGVFGAPSLAPSTRIEGLHLVGAGSGSGVAVSLMASSNAVRPTLVDLEIEQWSSGISTSVSVNGDCSPTFESVNVHHCSYGLTIVGRTSLTASDSNFSDNLFDGISVGGAHGMPTPTFRRCRIERNGGDGVGTSAGDYPVHTSFEDSSISFNGQHGWSAAGQSFLTRSATFERCTIAHNAGIGVYGFDAFNNCGSLGLSHSILWGHATDIQYDGTVVATLNDIGDGFQNGVDGNFAADPLFRNAAGHDLRLRWGSPCVDAAPAAGGLDLVRNVRDVDGNLDTIETADLGAIEFLSLEVLGPRTLGSILGWELHGPAGAPSTLYWARQPLASAPTITPFGQLDLPLAQLNAYRTLTIGPNSTALVQRSIPNAAALVGHTFSFQALTNNALAPNAKAYTNAEQITILP